MPIYEYLCAHCGTISQIFVRNHKNKQRFEPCEECDQLATAILSRFSTSPSLFKPLSGVDDTEDFTLGKLIANRSVPAEFKRKTRDKITNFKKKQAEYERRKHKYKFASDAKDN